MLTAHRNVTKWSQLLLPNVSMWTHRDFATREQSSHLCNVYGFLRMCVWESRLLFKSSLPSWKPLAKLPDVTSCSSCSTSLTCWAHTSYLLSESGKGRAWVVMYLSTSDDALTHTLREKEKVDWDKISLKDTGSGPMYLTNNDQWLPDIILPNKWHAN